MNNKRCIFLVIAVALSLPITLSAQIAVVVNPANSVSSIDAEDAKRLYLGKSSKFPDGSAAEVVDQNEGEAARAVFYSSIVGKSESQAKAFWSKQLFTGKGSPPEQVGGDAEVKAKVSANANAIGYIDASSLDSSVKKVLSVD